MSFEQIPHMTQELVLTFIGIAVAGYGLYELVHYLIHHHYDEHRMRDMVFLQVRVPRKESKEDVEKETQAYSAQKSFKEIIGIMTHFFESLHSMYDKSWRYHWIGQDYLSLEYAVIDGEIHFYMVVPRDLMVFLEKQITSFYPDCHIEKVTDYNIFKPNSQVYGCYMELEKDFHLPIKNYNRLNSDPLNAMVNALSKFSHDEGAAIQIIIKPVNHHWQHKGRELAQGKYKEKSHSGFGWYNPLGWISSIIDLLMHPKKEEHKPEEQQRVTATMEEEIKALDEKNSHPGFDTVIRVVCTAPTLKDAKLNVANIHKAFGQFDSSNGNEFEYSKYHSVDKLVKDFIFRRFRRSWLRNLLILPSLRHMIFSSEELASLYHLPSIRYNMNPHIVWQNYKVAPAPPNVPTEGILLGHNTYRGVTKEVRIKRDDRFRHFYVIGQTGTGKSSILQAMIRQDLRNGDGIAIIDPHGSLIEDIMPFIPRERADDVIYFNPGDMDRPMGLNLLEGDTWEEKERVSMEAMNIMIKLFGEEIFGPRIQDYFRNGCLTLMSDPEGGSITDIVRLFTDDEYAAYKTEKVTNPIVKSFWDNQMAKTGQREKQEMIPYLAAKFGQFVTNTMMRNIIGQAKSAFNLADVMENGKILLVNLSKGETGEMNSKLLGLIMVSKIQMAALSRQKILKTGKKPRDFFLYIDEFQNYVTDSIEVILSEARKYRLGLAVAHQYLAQLEDKGGGLNKKGSSIKEAIFGNVGSILAYKIGAQDAEYMMKEMAPVFSDQDLVNLDKFKAVMKLSIDTQPSRPFSITPLNPYLEVGDKAAAEAFKQLSRLKYGRDKDFVDREIIRRLGLSGSGSGGSAKLPPPADPFGF